MSEAIYKLSPHRTMYLRGFDRRGAAASLNNASAAGFTVSGCWSDQADFAVLVLHDADDLYGHLATSRYLPDFSLAGVTLDFDLALSGAMNPLSYKYQSVPWGSLSYITEAEQPSGFSPYWNVSLKSCATAATGGAVASRTFTVNGSPAYGDRIQLGYGSIVWDYKIPATVPAVPSTVAFSFSNNPGGAPPSTVTFGFFNWYGTGYTHSITIGSNTYSHVQLSTDGSGDIAAALANAINAASDPNATAAASANDVTLTPRLSSGASMTCTATDGNGPGTLTETGITADYLHTIAIGPNTYSDLQVPGDGQTSSGIATALANAINAASDPNATAAASSGVVTLTSRYTGGASVPCSASDGNVAGTLRENNATNGCYAADIAGLINATDWNAANPTTALMATAVSGATFTVSAARYGGVGVTGAAVTWLSGQNFLGSRPGDPFILLTQYPGVATTYTIATVNSPTSITLTTSTGMTGGAAFYLAPGGGRDGNSIELLEMHQTATAYLTPAGASKLTGGADPTSVHYHVDFTALGIDSCRQIWFTFAPPLNYDSGTVNAALVAYQPQEWSAAFSNWTTADPNSKLPLKIAGAGSVLVSSRDSWATYSGSGWAQQAGFYYRGFAQETAHAGDAVAVKYACQQTHNLYLGTALTGASGQVTAVVDGGSPVTVETYADTGTSIETRRLIATGIAAGSHTVTLTLSSTHNAASSGTRFLFDYLQAAVLSDPVTPATTYGGVNCACDFDTGQTYQIAPARALWILSQAGFAGDIDFYAGVFFALKRARLGGSFHQATVTISAGSSGFNLGTGNADGDSVTVTIAGTAISAAIYPADTVDTLAWRMVAGINAAMVGVYAAKTGTGQLAIASLSPINGFTLTSSYTEGLSLTFSFYNSYGTGYTHSITIGTNTYSHVQLSTDGSSDIATALANAINAASDPNATASTSGNNVILTSKKNGGANVTCTATDGNGSGTLGEGASTGGSISISGDIHAGNEGVWAVDASQASPLNRAFVDYLTDFCAQVKAAGQTMTVAFSQELLAPPDSNDATPASVTFGFFNYLGAGYAHNITIGSKTYTHIQLSTDGSGDIATALAALINVGGGDQNAVASVSANNVILAPRCTGDVLCTASDGNGPGTLKSGAWTQRFSDGTPVLTSTGFGSWGAGVVEAVSGSGPQTIQQTGHGYITGNTVHIASGTGSGVWAITVTDANHYQLTTQISNSGSFTPGVGDATFTDLQTTQCNFAPTTTTAYLTACYKQAAGIMAAAGLTPWLQFGEVGWWFYARVNGLAIGYASYTAPISIGTNAPHGLATGQGVIDAGVLGNTAANGDFSVTVTDATHFTLTGGGGNGNYVAGSGTVCGGGMAYYDAYTASAALSALGRALASFYTQDDDPSVNAHADANFLQGQIYAHMHAIAQAVKTAYPGAKFEWLLPMDVNNPTAYWNQGYPYPQGGRLNNYVNIPSQYTGPNGDIDRLKLEALSWGVSYLNLDLAKAAMNYGSATLIWPKPATAYVVPWNAGAAAWQAQYLAAVNAGIPLISLWAIDHLALFSWPLPLPTNARRAIVS